MERPINELHKGETLQNGKYKILDVLGKGGFGITYLAEHSALRKKVAIKELFLATQSIFCSREENSRTVRPHFDDYEKHKSNFANEATTLARFSGKKGVVQINDTFSENNTVYFVMDYIEGDSLKDIVNQRGALSEKEAIEYILQILYALKDVHAADILHRDIKPDNLIVRKEDKQIILIDFGIAREFTEDETQTQTAMISVGYAPPEQKILRAKRSASMDLYSVGAVLYFCLTSQRPQTTDEIMSDDYISAKQLNPQISQELSDFIDKAIDKKPSQRFQEAGEMISFLENYDSDFVSSVDTSTKANNTFNPVDSEQTIIFEEPKVIPTKKVEEQKVKPAEKQNQTPIFIGVGILLFLLVGFGMYKLGQQKTEVVDEAMIQADSVPSIGVSTEDLVVENIANEEVATTIEENNNLIADNSQQVEDEKQREKDKIKRKEEELKRKEAEEEKKKKLEEEEMRNITWEDLEIFKGDNNKLGYKHKKYGKVIINPQYDSYEKVSQGLAAVKRNGKWGFINEKGIEVVSPSYDFVDNFDDGGVSRVANNGKHGFINKSGKVVVPLKYDYVEIFSDGLAKVPGVGFIDRSGNLIVNIKDLPSHYECSAFFSEGLLWVRREFKYGFVNKKGQLVIDFIYSGVQDFSNGLSEVTLSGDTQYRRFYINKQGKCVKDCP